MTHSGHQGPSAATNRARCRSIIGLLDIPRTFAANRAKWAIEHDGTGGAELPFVLGKTKGYATHIRDSVLAKTKRIWGTGNCILLRISKCGKRCQSHDYQKNSAQFRHGRSSPKGAECRLTARLMGSFHHILEVSERLGDGRFRRIMACFVAVPIEAARQARAARRATAQTNIGGLSSVQLNETMSEGFSFTYAAVDTTALPGTLPLFATGLGALGLLLRRRRVGRTRAIR
jgi:hypothetical protein